MNEPPGSPIYELTHLLEKIAASESLLARARAYYDDTHRMWTSGVAAYFMDFIIRKQEQIDYEWYRVERMGMAIAQDVWPPPDLDM